MMKIKIAWLLVLIFCATLALTVADLDLGPFIKLAQCRSSCLRHHMTDDNCWELNKSDTQINDCYECWDSCDVLGAMEKEERRNTCAKHDYQNPRYLRLTIAHFVPMNSSKNDVLLPQCKGCETACKFYRTHGMENDKYEPTKLPAPEENKTIHMNNYDVAVVMQKNTEGIWEMENYYSAKQQLGMKPGGWIIVVRDDGVVKHYSWEKWRPTLEYLKTSDPLYQAYITWQDWRIQLKNQRERITSNYFKTIFELRDMKEKQHKRSFVVTWQEKTGNGITGNQVTESESAQISLPCGEYLIRIATTDGPGSYPIIVDTGDCESSRKWYITEDDIEAIYNLMITVLRISICLAICTCATTLYSYIKYLKEKKNNVEEKYWTETEARLIKETKLTKMQKTLVKQGVLTLCFKCSHSTVDQLIKGMNANVKTQDANTSTQKANANVEI